MARKPTLKSCTYHERRVLGQIVSSPDSERILDRFDAEYTAKLIKRGWIVVETVFIGHDPAVGKLHCRATESGKAAWNDKGWRTGT